MRFLFVLLAFLFSYSANAKPITCAPAFPDRLAESDLCIKYPLPGITADKFTKGVGKEAYVGTPRTPYRPGRVVGNTKGFWKSINWTNGLGTIKDSDRKSIRIKKAR